MDISESRSFSASDWCKYTSQFDSFDFSSEYIIAVDHAWRIVKWNASAEAAFEFSKKDAQGKSLNQLLGIEPGKPEANDSKVKEFSIAAENGSLICVACKLFVFREADGSIAGYLITMRDVTESIKAKSDLKALEDLYMRTFNTDRAVLMIRDFVLNGTYCSPKFKRKIGAEHLDGTELKDYLLKLIHPDDVKIFESLQDRMKRKEPSFNIEYRLLVNGSYICALNYGSIEYNEQGQPARAISMLVDITDRKKLETDLLQRTRELESREYDLVNILDGSSEGFWIWDFQNGTMEYSTEWKIRLGAEHLSGNALSQHIEDRIHPEDRVQRMKKLQDSISERTPKYVEEYRILTDDRGYIWVLARGKITYDASGTPLKLYAISIDISDRKAMERQLRNQAEELSTRNEELVKKEYELLEILDCAALGSWIVYLKEKTVVFSDHWLDYLNIRNLAADEQLNRTIDAVHPDDRELVIKYFRQGMFESFPYSGIEYRLKSPSDEYIWVSAKGKLSFGPQGKPEKFYGVCFDINDEKNAEIELKEKNKLIIDFFTNISHEFRTPLSIMQMDVDLISDIVKKVKRKNPDKMDRYISILRQNSYRLQRLIGNLLDITKLDAGFMSPHLRTVDIVALVSALTASVKDYAKDHKNIDVMFLCNTGALPMAIDPEKVERILLNLLSNSIKHTRSGGLITVDLDVQADQIRLSVADNGEGIPDDRKSIIFNRFKQVNTSLTRDSEGCGIGLSLTKALVELMGGAIDFESASGIGTKFFIKLPIKQEDEPINTVVTEGSFMTRKKVEMEFSDIM